MFTRATFAVIFALAAVQLVGVFLVALAMVPGIAQLGFAALALAGYAGANSERLRPTPRVAFTR
jgi:hypothetical protein